MVSTPFIRHPSLFLCSTPSPLLCDYPNLSSLDSNLIPTSHCILTRGLASKRRQLEIPTPQTHLHLHTDILIQKGVPSLPQAKSFSHTVLSFPLCLFQNFMLSPLFKLPFFSCPLALKHLHSSF